MDIGVIGQTTKLVPRHVVQARRDVLEHVSTTLLLPMVTHVQESTLRDKLVTAMPVQVCISMWNYLSSYLYT